MHIMPQTLMLKPDSKGRITLGKLAQGVSSYHVTVDKTTENITLEPYSEVPLRERWLFHDKEAMASLKRGIKQVRAGNVVSLGSFAKYVEE